MSFVAVSLFHAIRRSFTLFAYLLVRALSARITFIAVCPNADILCYFMLCFVLFFASWLSFIAVSLWKAPAHIHNVATLQPKKNEHRHRSFKRRTQIAYTPIRRFSNLYSLQYFCCAREKSCGEMPKPPAKQWMMIFLFDYKLCDQNDKPNIFTLFASQQLVLHSACALRFSGFTQTYGLNSQWKHKWCFVILMLINNSQR